MTKTMIEHTCENCNKIFNRKKDRNDSGRFCNHVCYSKWLIGRKANKETLEKQKIAMLGRTFSEESINKMKAYQSNRTKEHLKNLSIANHGEKASNWKGGISPLRELIRNNAYYISWRNDVLKRDNYTCQKCGKHGGTHHPHHKISFASILDKYNIKSVDDALLCKQLWDISNGETLCVQCHRKTETYGAKKQTW